MGALQNQSDFLAAELAEVALRESQKVAVLKNNVSSGARTFQIEQSEYGQRQSAFAGSAFPYQTEDFARRDVHPYAAQHILFAGIVYRDIQRQQRFAAVSLGDFATAHGRIPAVVLVMYRLSMFQ